MMCKCLFLSNAVANNLEIHTIVRNVYKVWIYIIIIYCVMLPYQYILIGSL